MKTNEMLPPERQEELLKEQLTSKNDAADQASQGETLPGSEDREQSASPLRTASMRQLHQREQELAVLKESLNDRAQLLDERERQLTTRESDLRNDRLDLQAEKESFEQQKRQEQLALQKKISELWEKGRKEQEKELDDILSQRLKQIKEEESQAREQADRRLAEYRQKQEESLAAQKQDFEADLARRRDRLDTEFSQREEKLDRREEALRLREQEQEERTRTLEVHSRQIEAMRQALKMQEDALPKCARRLADDRIADMKAVLEEQRQENGRLRERIRHFSALSEKLGNREPEELLLELRDRELRIDNLRQELAERPPRELRARYEELEARERGWSEERQRLEQKLHNLEEAGRQQAESEYELQKLRSENNRLAQLKDALEAHNNKLGDELRRLQSQYGSEADRNERIRDIENPCIKNKPAANSEIGSEIDWLEGIVSRLGEHGFLFPRRILHAFHTSLKIAEWSPITVLAGVSGTGKSELPRLYALFGGLNFMMVPVQPNWDSQESMLGFFNTLDNKFDAQPVLRFLAQSQKEASEDYPYGMKDAMNLVLLDEMNLAHMELYFAEFLSKLEARRGKGKNAVPTLDVKLGSGISPYQLPLGRNVLWTGTMNQDETTKALSDKVLDRSSVIHFPRPSELKRRTIKKLIPQSPESLLPLDLWTQWVILTSDFSDSEVAPYKTFVEQINKALSHVGRALGHRVWQSIEHYMVNYPAVRALRRRGVDGDKLQRTMRIAFEDQLVQKVMPKLRGIETRGKARSDCLDVIRNLLDEHEYGIVEDFTKACEMGYGQFMWNSADYLEQNGDEIGVLPDEIEDAHHEG